MFFLLLFIVSCGDFALEAQCQLEQNKETGEPYVKCGDKIFIFKDGEKGDQGESGRFFRRSIAS